MRINEKNFITELRKKNEVALDYVIDCYSGLIRAIIKKHLYNLESWQEECMDDVLLAIWNNIDTFDESKNTFKNWIAAISKYKSIDYKRKYLKLLQEESIGMIEEAATNPIEECFKEEVSQETEALLSSLSKEDRKIFLDYYINQKPIQTLAKEKGIRPQVLYNKLSRGRKKLKEIHYKIISREE